MPLKPTTLLLVSAQGDALGEEVRGAFPQLDVSIAPSDTAARAYLGASAFDVVVVVAPMLDETAASLKSLVESLGRVSHVLSGAPAVGLVEWLRDRLALEAPASPAALVASSTPEQADALAFVSAELSRIAHALNNPLAVIDGNAQLALELARALGVDASVISAIEDIQGGSQSLAALFSDIAALRARIDRL